MFQSITNMPIARRLFWAFVLVALFPAIIIAVLGGVFLNTLSQRGQASQAITHSITLTQQGQTQLETMHSSMQALIVLGAPPDNTTAKDLSNKALQSESQFQKTLDHVKAEGLVVSSPNMENARAILSNDANSSVTINKQKTSFDAIGDGSKLWENYKAVQDRYTTDGQKQLDALAVNQALGDLNDAYSQLQANWNDLTVSTRTLADRTTEVGFDQALPFGMGIGVALACTVALVIFVGYLINRTITDRLHELAVLTRRIKKGETNVRAPVAGRDEIYMVARSMNDMLDSIVVLIQETQGQRDVLQGQIEKLVSEVSGVGEGDLSIQAEVTADALGVLADSFNYMVEELNNLVVRVKMVAQEVDSSTTTILDRMTQLVESGDIQIDQINGAAVEVEHMADTSRAVAEHAQSLSTISREAQVNADSGRQAVTQAVEGMGRIHVNVQNTASKVNVLGERSREINNIVDVISSIAHQTNRLALDAAIQAAMAGENGKGFGAVAADIRRLAEQAKDQTSNITRIVRSVREDIGSAAVSMQDTERETSAGSQLAQEAKQALELIVRVIERQSTEISNINQMAMQQLQSSRDVVQIMHNVSGSTSENSANTREASVNMERLARFVEQLRASVEAFKVREEQTTGENQFSLVSPLENEESDMTMSGLFRTISATAQKAPTPRPVAAHHNSLAGLPDPSQSYAQVNTSESLPPQENFWENGNSFYNR